MIPDDRPARGERPSAAAVRRRHAPASRLTTLVLGALVLSVACRGAEREQTADELWLDPAGGRSAITAASTEADLIKRFGAGNVRRAEISYAESDVADGTLLFSDDSARRLEIVWHDSAARARPDFARVSGRSSRWVLAPDVRLGMTLAELEQRNGGPFTLGGADPNTGAFVVLSWNGGRLDSLWTGPGRVWLQLTPSDPLDVPEADMEQLTGDREIASGHPLLRRLDPRVDEISLGFEDTRQDDKQ